MSYDIYGNNLKRGHCEVHPQVGEEYPCSLCYAEDNNRSRNKQRNSQEQEYYSQEQEYYRQQEKEHYEAQERGYYEALTKKNNFLYPLLCLVAAFLAKCLKKVEAKKEVIYQNEKKKQGGY